MKDNYCPVLWGDCWNKISTSGEWDEKRLPEISGRQEQGMDVSLGQSFNWERLKKLVEMDGISVDKHAIELHT